MKFLTDMLAQNEPTIAADKLRIAYVISAVSTDNTGMGGHFRSALILAENMAANGAEVAIFTLGDIFPAPFLRAKVPIQYINFGNALEYYGRIMGAITAFQPTHVHSFDNKSHFFARLAARKLNCPTFLTKPGGPNRNTFFPFSKDIIGFSEENLSFLGKRRNLRRTTFHLIPNRVDPPSHDEEKVAKLRQRANIAEGDVVVLRICRIGFYYRSSILQTFALVKSLRQRGVNARALIVGFIQDQEVYNEIVAQTAVPADVVTDPIFTEKASDLLKVADIVVGTGRSFMEAAMQERLCATPLQGSETPVLVEPGNFAELARTNFSERNTLDGFDANADAQRLHQLLNCPAAREAHVKGVRDLVDQRFGMAGATKLYEAIYGARSHYEAAPTIDYVGNSLPVLRYYAPLLIKRIIK